LWSHLVLPPRAAAASAARGKVEVSVNHQHLFNLTRHPHSLLYVL
jgi:hypothetical protein